jgi:two-component system, LytTR family, sensor kinase
MERHLFRVHLAFWALYGIGHFLAVLPAVTAGERGAMALANGVRAATGCAVALALWPALRRVVREGRAGHRFALGLLVLATGLLLWPALDRLVLVSIAAAFGMEIPWMRFPRGVDLEYLVVLLGWSAAATAVLLWMRERQAREALLEQRAATHEAQVRALAARLNPHFLFNSLNTIRALVSEDTERARTTLTRLSEFLRHALSVDAAVPATLGEEVAAVRAYLRIEEARFEPDLEVAVTVDEAAAQVLVPPLFLQPLVENAVLHGAPGPDGVLRIRLEARMEDGGLRLEVVNTGTLGARGEGIGLELTRGRLRQMYGDAQRLHLSQRGAEVVAAVQVAAPAHRPRQAADVP